MSGLLSGLKFVGKKKEARGEDVADAGGAAAPAAAAARASMDWMSAGGPIDFTGERRRVCVHTK